MIHSLKKKMLLYNEGKNINNKQRVIKGFMEIIHGAFFY